MPFTRRRSVAVQKTAPFRRALSIRPARTRPTPGSNIRLSKLQELIGKGVVSTGLGGLVAAWASAGPVTRASSQRCSRHCSPEPTNICCRTTRPPRSSRKAKTIPRTRCLFSRSTPSGVGSPAPGRCSGHRWSDGSARPSGCRMQGSGRHPATESRPAGREPFGRVVPLSG